ncbi:uncharacterized protein LOC144798354 [Lissotriton helveticus]
MGCTRACPVQAQAKGGPVRARRSQEEAGLGHPPTPSNWCPQGPGSSSLLQRMIRHLKSHEDVLPVWRILPGSSSLLQRMIRHLKSHEDVLPVWRILPGAQEKRHHPQYCQTEGLCMT